MLRVTSIGIDDDFYSLGGDSLQWIQALAEFEDMLDVELNLEDYSDTTTIRGLLDSAFSNLYYPDSES